MAICEHVNCRSQVKDFFNSIPQSQEKAVSTQGNEVGGLYDVRMVAWCFKGRWHILCLDVVDPIPVSLKSDPNLLRELLSTNSFMVTII